MGTANEPAGNGPPGGLGRGEFTVMLALSMALAALGTDFLLPAFPAIRSEFGLPEDSTAVAGLVTIYFAGLAVGQLLFGPTADRFGRRPALYVGYGLYGIGALGAVAAPSLGVLLGVRFLWGLGAAGPRVTTMAMIRDVYDGDAMSRTMSLVLAVLIVVPILGPTVGAGLTAWAAWESIPLVCLIAVGIMALWMRRLPETLRDTFQFGGLGFRRLCRATRQVVSHRQTAAYTLAMAALYGVFVAYLSSAEVVLQETFGQTSTFPLIFGALASALALAMLANARIVERIGARRVAHTALLVFILAGGVMVVLAAATGGRPPLSLFLPVLAALLGCAGLLIPNLTTIALEPMEQVAGTAASVIGAVQTGGGALLASMINQAYQGTITPLAVGFLVYGLAALFLALWGEEGRLFQLRAQTGPYYSPASAASSGPGSRQQRGTEVVLDEKKCRSERCCGGRERCDHAGRQRS